MSILWVLMNLNVTSLPLAEAIFVLVFMAIMLASWIFTTSKFSDTEIYGFLAVILGFLYVYVVVTFINRFTVSKAVTILWSLAWLTYSLVLYLEANKQVDKHPNFDKVKTMGIIFLVITLIKIAFNDLILLSGGARIIGFMLFGLLLLIGGYKLKK